LEAKDSRQEKGKHLGFPSLSHLFDFESGAGEESRTLDLNLGKVALYQLSYSRIFLNLLLNSGQCLSSAEPAL
jgi:hypothetical protein